MPEMTVVTMEARRDRSRKVCRLLSERIAQVTSPGLGRWDPAWILVEDPSAQFLDALRTWEATGAEEAMERAKRLALDVLKAWKEAERRFIEADRPGTREGVPV